MPVWRRVSYLCSGLVIGGVGAALAQPLLYSSNSSSSGAESIFTSSSLLPSFWNSPSSSPEKTLAGSTCGMDAAAMRRKAIYARIFGVPPPAQDVQAQSEPVQAGGVALRSRPFGMPKDIRTRFMRYAKLDESTGEYVLHLEDFVSCMLLLPPSSLASDDDAPYGLSTSRATAGSAVQNTGSDASSGDTCNWNWLSHVVQRRSAFFFKHVDIDTSNTINYAEFVVLFTMLSSHRRTLQLAFGMFDEDSNNRLSEEELSRVLNTLMVDPDVQIVNPADVELLGKGAPRYPLSSATLTTSMLGPLPVHESPPPGSSHWKHKRAGTTHADHPPKLVALAKEDAEKKGVSFETFWFRMDFFRWELRALEFGTFDPENTGLISLDDCGHILSGNLWQRGLRLSSSSSRTTASSSSSSAAAAAGGNPSILESGDDAAAVQSERVVTWQLYQKVFDIVRDSDMVLPSMELALKALPPVPPGVLVDGAIPDNYARSPLEALSSKQKMKSGNDDDRASAGGASDKATIFVRPTKLTWNQFFKVLDTCDGVQPFTPQEKQVLVQLLSVLGSSKGGADSASAITPRDFRALCELKNSFFASYLPRFSEPKRNAVQQFFYCMQQLE